MIFFFCLDPLASLVLTYLRYCLKRRCAISIDGDFILAIQGFWLKDCGDTVGRCAILLLHCKMPQTKFMNARK